MQYICRFVQLSFLNSVSNMPDFMESFYQDFDEFRYYYPLRAFLIDDVGKSIGGIRLFNWAQLPYVTEKKTAKLTCCIYTYMYITYIHMRDMYPTEQTAMLAPSVADGSAIDVYLPTRLYRTHQLDFSSPPPLFRQDPSTIAIYFP